MFSEYFGFIYDPKLFLNTLHVKDMGFLLIADLTPTGQRFSIM